METKETTGYTFDPLKHHHSLDGKPLMGVTTVLQVISKPQLIQWAANMATDHIYALPISEEGDFVRHHKEDWYNGLKKARIAHRVKKEKGGDWGHIVHKAIEEWIKDNKLPVGLEGTQQMAFDHFREWSATNEVKFLESEKHVYSKEYWIGGICDLVIKMNGKKYVADIKTSSAIYNEAFFQMGAYDLCLREMDQHNDVEGYLVINLKKDGSIDTKMAVDMEINKRAFKAALELYKINQQLQ